MILIVFSVIDQRTKATVMQALLRTLVVLIASLTFSSYSLSQTATVGEGQRLILAQLSSMNCGLKPLPQLGYEIGRCINGQWEQVSKSNSSNMNCGLKPLPQLGYEIGRCINGQWEQVSKSNSSNINCGLKPLPKLGHVIGRCINGQWEQVSK